MKKQFMFIILAYFILALPAMTNSLTKMETVKAVKEKTIQQYKEDVTGNGKKDEILLTGIPYDKDSPVLKEITLKVKTDQDHTFSVPLAGIYEPTAQFKDLNHDGINDVFVSIATGGSGGIYNYYLYSFKNNKQTNVTVPEPLSIQGVFQDGYKALISIPETQESYTVDLSGRKEEYNQLGLYVNGKLNEATELMVDAYSYMKPATFGNAGYGLKSIQVISGAAHADQIGRVESQWYYKNGKWKLVDARFIPFE